MLMVKEMKTNPVLEPTFRTSHVDWPMANLPKTSTIPLLSGL